MKTRLLARLILAVGALALPATTMQAYAEELPVDEPAAERADLEAAAAREKIDEMSKEALQELLDSSPTAKALYDQAPGYAVFRATKAGFLVTGAGGSGVTVNKRSGERTYMRMGSGGVGVGAGIQNFRLIVLFETEEALQRFSGGGWDAATSAQAAAGKAGVNAASSFVDHVAIFQLTDKGLMAQADLTGTRFWRSEKLNPRNPG